jgi:hypothetical protein
MHRGVLCESRPDVVLATKGTLVGQTVDPGPRGPFSAGVSAGHMSASSSGRPFRSHWPAS